VICHVTWSKSTRSPKLLVRSESWIMSMADGSRPVAAGASLRNPQPYAIGH
jgi:hypothetical protein